MYMTFQPEILTPHLHNINFMPRKIETAANIISDVEQLKKTVYTGNGEPSLTNQMSALTIKVEYLEKSLNDKLDHTKDCIEGKIENLSEDIQERDEEHRHDESKRNKLVTTAIAGAVSILIAVISYLLST